MIDYLIELWNAFSVTRAMGVFFILLFADLLWTEWTNAVIAKQPIRAGFMSTGTVMVSAFTAISYMANPLYIIPAICGAFIGTYVAVRRKM